MCTFDAFILPGNCTQCFIFLLSENGLLRFSTSIMTNILKKANFGATKIVLNFSIIFGFCGLFPALYVHNTCPGGVKRIIR